MVTPRLLSPAPAQPRRSRDGRLVVAASWCPQPTRSVAVGLLETPERLRRFARLAQAAVTASESLRRRTARTTRRELFTGCLSAGSGRPTPWPWVAGGERWPGDLHGACHTLFQSASRTGRRASSASAAAPSPPSGMPAHRRAEASDRVSASALSGPPSGSSGSRTAVLLRFAGSTSLTSMLAASRSPVTPHVRSVSATSAGSRSGYHGPRVGVVNGERAHDASSSSCTRAWARRVGCCRGGCD